MMEDWPLSLNQTTVNSRALAFLILQSGVCMLSQKYDVATVDTYDAVTALIDNIAYSWVSEMGTTSQNIVSHYARNATWTRIITPSVFLSVGSAGVLSRRVDPKSVTVSGMTLIWSLRIGIKESFLELSKNVKQLSGYNNQPSQDNPDYYLSFSLCIPTTVLKTHFPGYELTDLVASMACSLGSSAYEDARLNDLRIAGHSEEQANLLCARENFAINTF